MATTMVQLCDGRLSGPDIEESCKTLGGLTGVFADEQTRQRMPQDQVVYRVQAHMPASARQAGGLFFGTSIVEPGAVAGEYFMTRGHFHSRREMGEYYWCIGGSGLLLLMDEKRVAKAVAMTVGVLAYIPGFTAHRLVNTGAEPLVVGACWPADAGHDYATIDREGFAIRVMCVDGKPQLVEV